MLLLYGSDTNYTPMVEAYKKVRPDGKIFLASDMNTILSDKTDFNSPAFQSLLNHSDVIATASRAVQMHLSAKWHVPIALVRYPFYNFDNVSFDNLFEHKENIILTVGRIGDGQKRNETLLEAFAKCADELPDWTVRLVGNVDEDFKPYVENYFARNPHLTNRVIFVGNIDSKAELMEEYKRAKIFCLTSTYEGGCPNVTGEALFGGCYIISSAIDAKDDMVDGGRCGKIFPLITTNDPLTNIFPTGDIEALAKIFREVCRDDKLLLEGGKRATEYAREEFDANQIVARLYYLLFGG